MRDELERFVASLAVPADRKAIVLAELLDHAACAAEKAVRDGRDPEAASRAALGNLEVLRHSLEAVEPAFQITRGRAFANAVVAGVLVAIVIDQIGTWLTGLPAAVLAIAIAVVLAPPHVLDLLRAELRAPRIRGTFGARGIAIGPALTYAYTVMSVPFLVWIGMIVERAFAGVRFVDIPWSAFVLMAAVYLLLFVEGIRARRRGLVA